jgi:O-succinylbenzoate synthase
LKLFNEQGSRLLSTLTTKSDLLTIKSVALHHVSVPLLEPFRISNGEVTAKEAILVEVTTTDGVTGWGEASPMSGSFYSSDTPESSYSALSETLVPLVLSSEIDVPAFYETLRRQPVDAFAKAGIEGALWDVYAKRLKKPLFEVLGTDQRPIPSGVAIGIYDKISELIERVKRYLSEGYQRVKIKIQPGWDVEPVTAIRSELPDLALMVDANAAYSLDDISVFRELDKHDLMMIEQPLARDAIAEAGELQKQLRTALCADESAESMHSLELLVQHQAARIINIKVQRVGGLSEARLMLELARAARLECWVGTMPELGVASAQGLALACNEGFSYPTDIEASSRWYVDDVIEPQLKVDTSGFIHLPATPGSGYDVSREKINKYAL